MITIDLKTLHSKANNDTSAFEASLAAYQTKEDLCLSVSDNTALRKLGDPFRLSTLNEPEFHALCEFIKTAKNLTEIHFNATLRHLSKEQSTRLLNALSQKTNLRVLHLNHNDLGNPWEEEQIHLLLTLIQNNEKLTQLDLSFNQLETMHPDLMKALLEAICAHKTLVTANIEPNEIATSDHENYLILLIQYANKLPSAHFNNLGTSIKNPDFKKHYDAFVFFLLLTNAKINTLEISVLPDDKDLFVDTLEKNTKIHTAPWIQTQKKQSDPLHFQAKNEKERALCYHDYYTNTRMNLIIARNYLLNQLEFNATLIEQMFIFLECHTILYLDTPIPIEHQWAYQAAIDRCNALYGTIQQTISAPEAQPHLYPLIPLAFKTEEETRLLYSEMLTHAQKQPLKPLLEPARIRHWRLASTHENEQHLFLHLTLNHWTPRTINLHEIKDELTPEFFRDFPCKHTVKALKITHSTHLSQLPSDTFDALCQFIATLPRVEAVLLDDCFKELTDERLEQLITSLIQNRTVDQIHLTSAEIGLRRESTQRTLIQLVETKPMVTSLHLKNNHLFAMDDVLFENLIQAMAHHPSLNNLSLHTASSRPSLLSDAKLKALTQHAANLPCDDIAFSQPNAPLYPDFLAALLLNKKIARLNLDALLSSFLDTPETLERLAKIFEKNTAIHCIKTDDDHAVSPCITNTESHYHQHSLYQTYSFQTAPYEKLAHDEHLLTELKNHLNAFRAYNARRTFSMITSRNYLLHFGSSALNALNENTLPKEIDTIINHVFYFVGSFYELYVETKYSDNGPQRDIPDHCQPYYYQAIDMATQLTFTALKKKSTLHEGMAHRHDIKAHYDRLMMCHLYFSRKNPDNTQPHKEAILKCAQETEYPDITDPIALAENAEPEIQATHRNNEPERGDIPKTHPYLKDTWLKAIYGHSIVFSGAPSRPQTPANASTESENTNILNLNTAALLQERSKEDIKAMRETLKALTEKKRATLKAELLTLTENCKNNHDPLLETLKTCANHPEKYYFFTILQTGSSSGTPTLFHNTGSFNKFMEMIKSGVEEKLSVVSSF